MLWTKTETKRKISEENHGVLAPYHTERWCKAHLVEAIRYMVYVQGYGQSGGKCWYEFGTYTGESAQLIENLYYAHSLGYRHGFAIDSFEGLPPEADGLPRHYACTGNGFFDAAAYPRFQLKNTDYVKCWYKDLGREQIDKYGMGPAGFIHIDCDLYISTYEALDFMFKHNLMCVGTVIAYDEFKLFHPTFAGGEARAHQEIMKKYNVETDEIYRNIYYDRGICWQSVFVIRKIHGQNK